VPHPIPPQHNAARASSGAHVSAEESDEGTNVDAYLNTAMFSTPHVQILLLPI
jgi:hypothetical protein